MARTATINKSQRILENATKLQEKRDAWKKTAYDATVSPEERRKAQEALFKTRSYSMVRVKRRCQVNGRGKGVFRRFGMCRNVIRQLMMEGYFPGGRKSSW